jgi:hypothetical protein
MRGQYEQEASALGRRADVDLSIANGRVNQLEAENAALVRELEQVSAELRAAQKLLRISSHQIRNAAARERRLKQQPSVGENLLARSTTETPVAPKRSRKIIEA